MSDFRQSKSSIWSNSHGWHLQVLLYHTHPCTRTNTQCVCLSRFQNTTSRWNAFQRISTHHNAPKRIFQFIICSSTIRFHPYQQCCKLTKASDPIQSSQQVNSTRNPDYFDYEEQTLPVVHTHWQQKLWNFNPQATCLLNLRIRFSIEYTTKGFSPANTTSLSWKLMCCEQFQSGWYSFYGIGKFSSRPALISNGRNFHFATKTIFSVCYEFDINSIVAYGIQI